MKLVAEKIFHIEDQQNFALISADYNPIHLDIVSSRKSKFEKPIVHGINLLLWSIDNAYKNKFISYYPTKLKVQFFSALTIDSCAQVFVKQASSDKKEVALEVKNDEALIMQASLETDDYSPAGNFKLKNIIKKTSCNNLSFNDAGSKEGFVKLGLDIKQINNLYPELAKILRPLHLAAIIATSRIVGMECPGLLSVYSDLDLDISSKKDIDQLNYKVIKTDRRFRLLSLAVSGGGVNGQIKAFVRAKIDSASCVELKKLLQPQEFSGQRALIIGGSRGIGEAASKLLALGGADVMLTYHICEDGAKQVVRQIRGEKGIAGYLRFDITNSSDNITSMLPENWMPTHLYYFATPKIFLPPSGHFNNDLHNNFNKYYIEGFYKIISDFAKIITGTLKVFYPSTVAIDEMPSNMIEYCVSKAGGEMLCCMIEKKNRNVAITKPRLPKVMTYQTESFLPGKKLPPETVVLPYLREIR